MWLLRFLLKILLSPITLALLLIEWIGAFLVNFGGTILIILSGIVFVIAVASGILLSAPGAEVLKMLIIAFALYLIPNVGKWFICKVRMLRFWIGRFLPN